MGSSSNYIKERNTDKPKRIALNTLNNISKSICKIVYEINEKKFIGTAFFMILNNNQKGIITNYHNIHKDLIDKYIEIEIHNNKKINIKLNKEYLNFFEDLDITIIKLEDSDNIIKNIINDINFLDYDLKYINGYNQYNNNDVFALQFPQKEIEHASGKILEIINNNSFIHNIDTIKGSSGSPIISVNTEKVIGIHKGGDKEDKINYGSFIGEIFKNNLLNKEENLFNDSKIKSNLKPIEKKEYNKDGQLIFEGEYLNGRKWNGNIKQYDYNNDLLYEEEYYNGKRTGKRKEFYKGNLKFEGQYYNEKRNGMGKVYYNGKLIYEWEYLNDKRKRIGKGKEYYDNGKLKYEGEYLNGKRNGKGKEYYSDGKLIFEGEYLNGEKWNGKGKEYYDNGKLKFEGEYLNGKRI